MRNLLSRFIYTTLFLTLFFVLAGMASAVTNCYTYDSDETTCTSTADCQWHEDPWGSWCEQKGCWNFFSESQCNGSVASINKSCNWFSGSSGWCQQTDCWQLRGTSNASCEGNNLGLNCKWEARCSGVNNCWTYNDAGSCGGVEGCTWGECYRKGCWDGTTQSECSGLTGYNGQSCSWNAADSYCFESGCWDHDTESLCTSNNCTWEFGYCSDPWCDDYSYTNSSACINNIGGLNCVWDSSANRCDSFGCWNYGDQSSCDSINSTGLSCSWSTDNYGWCEEEQCWSFDNITLGGSATEAGCVNNTANLSCVWDGNGGWCYQDVSISQTCSSINNEKECFDTFYCWWEGGQVNTCIEPEWGNGTFSDDTFFSEWNPGCYIFDNNQTDCENVEGCTWSGTGCDGNEELGINCTLVNNSNLCNDIPALSTCCEWQGDSVGCVSNWADHSCFDQIQTPPEGATYCEDYNSYDSESLCNEIANTPWYMPCKWDNASNHCEFNSGDILGGDAGFERIDNERNCEAAGGKWVLDAFCEGNRSVSAGRCEHKFDEDYNCNQKCYGCEYQNDGTNYSSLANARTACENSKAGLPPEASDDVSGWCEFNAYSSQHSDGRWGECSQNDEAGVVGGSCSSSDCGACTYLGQISDGSSAQICSAAGCKWFVDPLDLTNGWCGDKNEKSCSESCEKCYDNTACRETGKGGNQSCKWDDSTFVCLPDAGSGSMELCWDGVDNDGNGNTDCADSKCFSDPFCGGNFIQDDYGIDCFGFYENSTCTANNGY